MKRAVPIILLLVLIAGCPNGPDMMWCLKRRSDARWVDLPDGTMALKKNAAMRAYEKRFSTTKEH